MTPKMTSEEIQERLRQIDSDSLDRGPTPPAQAEGNRKEIAKHGDEWAAILEGKTSTKK